VAWESQSSTSTELRARILANDMTASSACLRNEGAVASDSVTIGNSYGRSCYAPVISMNLLARVGDADPDNPGTLVLSRCRNDLGAKSVPSRIRVEPSGPSPCRHGVSVPRRVRKSPHQRDGSDG